MTVQIGGSSAWEWGISSFRSIAYVLVNILIGVLEATTLVFLSIPVCLFAINLWAVEWRASLQASKERSDLDAWEREDGDDGER